MTPIIDAHHHLWTYQKEEYEWIDDSMEILRRDYLVEELDTVCGSAGVSGTIAVQARQNLKETDWLLSVAEANPRIRGVVGWVDLRGDRLGDQLRKLTASGKLVGVRHVLQDEPERDLMLRPSFMEGIAKLQPLNLVYDLLIFPDQLEFAVRLAASLPEQRFVLDHLAKPPVRSGRLHPWNEHLLELARCPNVWCKISGLVTEADHLHWSYESLIPYLEVAAEAFGAERIMVGSDWPVCLLAAEYREVMSIYHRFFDGWDPADRMKIFFQNAVDCYKLESG